jgi:hypothetical protein
MSHRPRLPMSLGVSLWLVRATPSGGKRRVRSPGSRWPAARTLIRPSRRPLGLALALVVVTRGGALVLSGHALGASGAPLFDHVE